MSQTQNAWSDWNFLAKLWQFTFHNFIMILPWTSKFNLPSKTSEQRLQKLDYVALQF